MRKKALDDTDRLIIHLLRRDVLMSNVALAKRLGIATATIASRIRSLVEARVMIPTVQRAMRWEGYEFLCFVDIEVRGRPTRQVADELAAIRDVAVVAQVMGGAIRLHTFARDHAGLVTSVIVPVSKIAGVARVTPIIALRFLRYEPDLGMIVGLPQASIHDPATIDDRIVDALSRDARIGYRAVARELSISETQVRARVKKLQVEKLIHIGLMLDADGAGFKLIVYMKVSVEPRLLQSFTAPLLVSKNVTTLCYVTGEHNLILTAGFGDYEQMSEFVRKHLSAEAGVLDLRIEPIIGCTKHRYELIPVL